MARRAAELTYLRIVSTQLLKHDQMGRNGIFCPSATFTKAKRAHYCTAASGKDKIVRSPLPDVVLPNMTIDQYVWSRLDQWSDRDALVCGKTGRKYTYAELRDSCRKFAAFLIRQNYKPGTVLVVMLQNTPEYPIVVLGALEAGLVVSTMNPAYTEGEIVHQLSDCDASVIVTFAEHLPKIRAAVGTIESKLKKSFPLFTICVSVNESEPAAEGAASFREIISQKWDAQQVSTRDPHDVALLPYSSGTTGLSKGVLLSHFNVVSNFQQCFASPPIEYIRFCTKDHQDVIPGVLPFFHIYGLAVIVLSSLSRGAKVVTLPKFEVASFLSVLKNQKSTVVFAVPPIVLFLGNHESVTSEHLAHVRNVVNGAGPIAASDGEKLVKKAQNKEFSFNQAYGLTETSPCVFVSPMKLKDYSSVGICIPNTEIKLVDQHGNLCGPEDTGEIRVKGPQVMKGYHKKLNENREVFDEDSFFCTGDVAYYNKEGHFYIVERIKELIKVKGFQVPPAELEGIIRTVPGVLETGVIGIPDERTGERPLAFVVKEKGKSLSREEIMTYVSEKVSPYKRLSDVIFVDEVPKNPSGKILRRILKEDYLKTVKSKPKAHQDVEDIL